MDDACAAVHSIRTSTPRSARLRTSRLSIMHTAAPLAPLVVLINARAGVASRRRDLLQAELFISPFVDPTLKKRAWDGHGTGQWRERNMCKCIA